MTNIRLKELLEANVDPKLVARSKESGKLVYFKTPQAKDAALKAGSHEDPKAKKGGEPNVDAKPNDMFGGDYAKDRGGEAPKANTPKVNLPKKASQLNSKHAESLEKAINAEVGLNGFVDTDDYTDAIIYTASTGNEPTYTLYFGSNSDYGKPDEFRVTFASTAIDNDPSNIGNKFDKSFKSAEDAMKYTIALAKKYKKELEMDDAAPKADTSKVEKSKYDDKEYWKDDEYSNTQGYIDSDDEDSEEDDDYDEESSEVRLTSDRLSKVEKALQDDLNLRGNGFETTRESSGGGGGWEGPMTIVSKDADYNDEDNFISLSVGSPNNDGKFSIVFANSNGEPYFEPNYDALTGDIDLEPQQAYKVTKALMKMTEIQKLLKGEISIDEFQPIYDKLKSKFSKTESTKLTSMIKK